MEKLIYTNKRGETVVLGGDAPYILTKVEGTGAVVTNIQTQKSPMQDGESYIDSTLTGRDLPIEITILANNMDEMSKHKHRLLHVLNPKLGTGRLIYQVGSISREIQAIPESAPILPNARPFEDTMQPCLIQMYCPNPFFLDIEESQLEIVSWIGGMTFPLRLPTRFSLAGENQVNIFIQGDVGSPIKVEITGPATNPKLTNVMTGEYIRIKRALLSGDTLVITTDFGRKRVEINGQNAFNYIDLTSTFFNLNPGDNILELTTEDINDDARVKISYKNRYLGV